MTILDNRDWYCVVPATRIQKDALGFFSLINQARSQDIIDQDTWEFIRHKGSRRPTLYALPKSHKSMTNPTVRPIVTGVGSLTERESRIMDAHVTFLSSYTTDTPHLLSVLDSLYVPLMAWLVATLLINPLKQGD